jgi:hypothetical protein
LYDSGVAPVVAARGRPGQDSSPASGSTRLQRASLSRRNRRPFLKMRWRRSTVDRGESSRKRRRFTRVVVVSLTWNHRCSSDQRIVCLGWRMARIRGGRVERVDCRTLSLVEVPADCMSVARPRSGQRRDVPGSKLSSLQSPLNRWRRLCFVAWFDVMPESCVASIWPRVADGTDSTPGGPICRRTSPDRCDSPRIRPPVARFAADSTSGVDSGPRFDARVVRIWPRMEDGVDSLA